MSGESQAVELVGLTKAFGAVRALQPLDLEIKAGELVVLVGPSGCGKSTILRLIAGLEEPSGGEVRIGGRGVNEREPAQRDIAMVFQNYALYPHMTVRQNLAFGLRMRRRSPAEILAKVEWAAGVLGLEGLLQRRPAQLSGGQKQRVAFGRAVVREPSVFLFDEPLSNLDARLRAEMRDEIAALHRRLGTTMVYVTHDQVEAMTLGERVAVLKDGVLQQYEAPLEVYRRPANLFVAGFIGTPAINRVSGHLRDEGSLFECERLQLRVPSRRFSGPATLAVRPEAITVQAADSPGAAFGSRVSRLEPLGNEVLVHFEGPAGTAWVARLEPERRLALDDAIGLALDPRRVHLFAGDSEARLEPETT